MNLITNELALLDQLPNAAHIDVHTVAVLFGCKVPTIWARLRRGEIPKPRKFGAHTRWNLGVIREALKGDKTEHDLTPDSIKTQEEGNKPSVTGQVNGAATSAGCPSGKTIDTRRKNAQLEKEEGQLRAPENFK